MLRIYDAETKNLIMEYETDYQPNTNELVEVNGTKWYVQRREWKFRSQVMITENKHIHSQELCLWVFRYV